MPSSDGDRKWLRGCHNTAKCEAEGSQRAQQRVDHSLSYTMKKKKRFDKCRMSSFYHHTKNCGSNRPKGANLAFWVLGTGAGLGTAGLEEGGPGFPCLAQSGPWGALKRWPCDPAPHSGSVKKPGRQREDIILCVREGVGEEGLSQQGFKQTWSGREETFPRREM